MNSNKLVWQVPIAGCVVALAGGLAAVVFQSRPPVLPTPVITHKIVQAPAKVEVFRSERIPEPKMFHPKHEVIVWRTRYKGRTFQVIQLPRCEHLEAIISHEPGGETLMQAEKRLGGVAAMSGSFHDPRTLVPVDFLQRQGVVTSSAQTGRWFLAITWGQVSDISDNYLLVKDKAGVDVIALGQRLVPLHEDGFSTAFMNQVTDRMALGLGKNYIYIVQGKSDIWRLASFMEKTLPITIAINSDGGHVVKGRAPVHIVFRWRKANGTTPPKTTTVTRTVAMEAKNIAGESKKVN
jgi:hypothetical protein